jgi:long-chain acyl-CoA synthetase
LCLFLRRRSKTVILNHVRQLLYKKLNELKNNDVNYIAFFKNGKRYQKSYSELYSDIKSTLEKIEALGIQSETPVIAIIGPISYDWLVLDLACLLGGIRTVAVPETFPEIRTVEMLQEISLNIVLVDASLSTKLSRLPYRTLYYGSNTPADGHFETIFHLGANDRFGLDENRILEDFSIVYSSGTSDLPKRIQLRLPTWEKKDNTLRRTFRSWKYKLLLRFSFWSRCDNKILIYMPFSHAQQRGFARTALLNKVNIVLSDSKNWMIHLIREKPNILISVPFVYETIGKMMSEKIASLNGIGLFLFRLQALLKINRLNWRNPIRKLFSRLGLSQIERLYGGRSDFFITGSAPIDRSVIDIFESSGAKLYEAYGLTEVGVVAMNKPGSWRKGSVGKPQMPMKLSEEGEVLVKFDAKVHDKEVIKLTEDGYIRTGDIGYLDKAGYLYLKGRMDEVLVLGNGKKIFPRSIENRLRKHPAILQAFIFVNDNKEICVVLSIGALADEQDVRDMIKDVNEEGASYEAIKRFHIADERFTSDNGMVTRNFKLKDKDIYQKYVGKTYLLV